MQRGGGIYIDIEGRPGHFEKNMRKVEKRSDSLGKRMQSSMRRARVAYLAIAAAIGVVLKSYMQQEKAEALLGSALRSSGQNVREYSAQLRALASEMQELTVYGDEQILQAMTLATNYGVLATQMEQVIKQAIGLVALRGGQIKLADAIRYVVFAQRGLFGELGQSLPVLRTVNTEIEKMALFQKLTAAGWKQAQKERQTDLGQLLAMKNRWSDVGERIGKVVMPALESLGVMLDHLIALVDKLGLGLLNLKPPSKEFRDWEERWAGMSKGPPLVKAVGTETPEFYQGRMHQLWKQMIAIQRQRRELPERYGLAWGWQSPRMAGPHAEYEQLGKTLEEITKKYDKYAKKLSELPKPKPLEEMKGPMRRELVGLESIWRRVAGSDTAQDKMVTSLNEIAKNTKETAEHTRDGESGATMVA